MKPFLNFKQPHMEAEFERLHEKLQAVVYLYALFMWINYGEETTVTDVYRPDDPDSVHHDFRGCDLRTRGIAHFKVRAATRFVNISTVYDPKRPSKKLKCAVYKLTGKKAEEFGTHEDHVHAQVHYRTEIFFPKMFRTNFNLGDSR